MAKKGIKQTKQHIEKRMIGASKGWFKIGSAGHKGYKHSKKSRKQMSEKKISK
jgi:hypothetical protein